MANPEPRHGERDISERAVGPRTSTPTATWRYIGDRTAADLAYCAHFGVSQAPEPFVALGGAWAYAVTPIDAA